jgi:LPS-assembly lipoprotein
MLSSKKLPVLRAFAAIVALGSLTILSSCQVRPLYASAEAGSALASIAISPASNRVEQQVRNELIFMLNSGEGEPANHEYELALKVSSSRQDFFTEKSTSSAPLPSHVIVTASYSLTKSGKVVAKATRTSMALFDYPSQQYARIRAQRDAENRAAREIAEQLRTDLAIALQKP